jgi:hypothetical protein
MRRTFLTRCLVLTAPIIFSACASIGPPQPPSLNLPKPPTDLRAVRKGDRVILTWTIPATTTDRQTIRTLGPTQICRGPDVLKGCGAPVSKTTTPIPQTATQSRRQRVEASYTDTLPPALESDTPSASITYAVEVLNRDGRGAGLSNQAPIPLIRTLPPPLDFQAQVTAQGIVLGWTSSPSPVIPNVHYLYRVYRREKGASQPTLAGELPAGSEPRLTLTDSGFEWQKTFEYHLRTITVISEPDKPEVRVEGDDTPGVIVFANDVFPPAVPSSLQAVFSGPGQQPFIDLVWAPVTDVDLAGYNVYRREEGTEPAKLNGELIKTPAYRDTNVVSGKRYIYSVSAVDVRGNESAKSEEASEAVP